MMAMLFRGAGRQNDELLHSDRVIHLGPGQAIVAVFRRSLRHGEISLLSHQCKLITLTN